MQVQLELTGPNGEENYTVDFLETKLSKIDKHHKLETGNVIIGGSPMARERLILTKWQVKSDPEKVSKLKYIRYNEIDGEIARELSLGFLPTYDNMVFNDTILNLCVMKDGQLIEKIPIGVLKNAPTKIEKSGNSVFAAFEVPHNQSGITSIMYHQRGPFYKIEKIGICPNRLDEYTVVNEHMHFFCE